MGFGLGSPGSVAGTDPAAALEAGPAVSSSDSSMTLAITMAAINPKLTLGLGKLAFGVDGLDQNEDKQQLHTK